MTREAAYRRIEAFRNDFGGAPSAHWPHIRRADLAFSLTSRVNDPNVIAQGPTPLCGPASMMRILARDNPLAYVTAAAHLFDGGAARLGNMLIAPGQTLMLAAVPDSMNIADWIMLASIRDSENYVFSSAGWFGSNLAGITTGSEVASWLRAVGYTRIAHVTFPTQPQYEVGCHMMEDANGYLGRDYWVLLLIDKDLLYSHSQNDWVSMYPNHWIVIDTPLSPSGRDRHTHVSLRCWTLGSMMDIPADRSIPLERRNFIHKFYGYVAAHL